MMKSFAQFIEAIEYVTGDRTHSNYAADHGGSNYHDHIAYKDKATRDAAMAHLRKLGWEIGSQNDGRHVAGSYHYSDQAFDIPMYRPSGGGVQHGFSDDRAGEEAMSRKLRADLAAGGFAVGGNGRTSPTAPSPRAKSSVKGALNTPAPTRVLAKLKGKTGELDKTTGKFTKRDWSSTEGSRYKKYGGK